MKVWVRTSRMPGPEGCRFIEVEDAGGVSHGGDVGLDWRDDREGGALLGPFEVPDPRPIYEPPPTPDADAFWTVYGPAGSVPASSEQYQAVRLFLESAEVISQWGRGGGKSLIRTMFARYLEALEVHEACWYADHEPAGEDWSGQTLGDFLAAHGLTITIDDPSVPLDEQTLTVAEVPGSSPGGVGAAPRGPQGGDERVGFPQAQDRKLYGLWAWPENPAGEQALDWPVTSKVPPIFTWESEHVFGAVHRLFVRTEAFGEGGRPIPLPDWMVLEPGRYVTGLVPEPGFSFSATIRDDGPVWKITPPAVSVDEYAAVIPKVCAGARLDMVKQVSPPPDPFYRWTLSLLLVSGAEAEVREWDAQEDEAVAEWERVLDAIREAHA